MYKQKSLRILRSLKISTKNLLTFKRCEGVKDQTFLYCGVSVKNPIFREGGGHEKPTDRGGIA